MVEPVNAQETSRLQWESVLETISAECWSSLSFISVSATTVLPLFTLSLPILPRRDVRIRNFKLPKVTQQVQVT